MEGRFPRFISFHNDFSEYQKLHNILGRDTISGSFHEDRRVSSLKLQSEV